MLKELMEKRAKLTAAMQDIIAKAKDEKRAVSDEENADFEAIEKEISEIDRTIALEKRAIETAKLELEGTSADSGIEQRSAASIEAAHNAVNAFIRGEELRAGEMSVSGNGIIPTEFSQDIIHKVTELAGVLQHIDIVNSKGTYKQIVADNNNKISAGWTSELAEVTSSQAKFKTIEIKHHKLGSLSVISNELINQNEFDISNEVTNQMVQDFALKSETAVLCGTGTDQPTGLTASGTAFTLEAQAAITAQEVIRIFHKLKSTYQQNAVWIMSNDTLCAIRLLADSTGRFLFHQSDLTTEYVGTILGKPVLISEAMSGLGAGNKPILFGDFKRAYKANLNPDLSIQTLIEKYATQDAVGILGFMYIDGKPVNSEAYVTVSCAADTSST